MDYWYFLRMKSSKRLQRHSNNYSARRFFFEAGGVGLEDEGDLVADVAEGGEAGGSEEGDGQGDGECEKVACSNMRVGR